MIDRFEAFTFAILEIYHCWNKIAAQEMEVYGLKGAHSSYIMALLRNPDGITAANLCELCGKDKAEISRSVSELEKRGLVVRENVGGNSYRALIKLTDEGKKAASFVRQKVEAVVSAAGSGITDDDRKVLYRALSVITSNLKEISKEGRDKA